MSSNDTTIHNTEPAGPLELIILVAALLVQQDAFTALPIIMSGEGFAGMREFDNPVNTFVILASLVFIGLLSIRQLPALVGLCRANAIPVLFTGLVISSTIWSFHPEITFRRAISYVLTMLLAALLSVRLDSDRLMRLLSISFAISGVASILFVLVAPEYGIMHGEEDLEGCWQGVFCTKEQLGSVMATAAFIEMYLLVQDATRQRWRFGLLAMFCALIVLSHSTTALLTIALYSVGALVFLLWRRHWLLGASGMLGAALAATLVAVVFWFDPGVIFSNLGKDSTLTGRTKLWPLVLELVQERPIVGWGYRAMWQPTDAITNRIDDLAGFAVPSSHNALLEIALELGVVGVILMLLFLAAALRRGLRCFHEYRNPLGWFLILFVLGCLFAGLTTETLGRNQVIEWVVLNGLFFCSGFPPATSLQPRGRVQRFFSGREFESLVRDDSRSRPGMLTN